MECGLREGRGRTESDPGGEVNELFCMGYADDFRDGIAYCVITTSLGPTDAEIAASDLIDAGIRPRRRFECDIVGGVPCNFRAVPDVEITEDRYREIDEMLAKAFPDEPQDDYP